MIDVERVTVDGVTSWRLVVDGVERMAGESFAVVDGVRWYLEDPDRWEPTELAEIAESIRRNGP